MGCDIENNQNQNLPELFNFVYILQGEVNHLKRPTIITKEYINRGLVALINPAYGKKEISILKSNQWKEYQKLRSSETEMKG